MEKKVCVVCNEPKWGCNARGVCPDCTYKKNHKGKSRMEVALEKRAASPMKSKRIKSRPATKEKRKDLLAKDRELYFFWFTTKPNKCEECGTPLPEEFEDENGDIIQIGQYSHIISKGSQPKYRHNKLNGNRLCGEHHTRWESGQRLGMKILADNLLIIDKIVNGNE